MLSMLEEKRIKNNLVSIKVYLAINDKGDLLMFPSGYGEDIRYYIENNINQFSVYEFYENLLTLMDMSLNKNRGQSQVKAICPRDALL